MLLIHNTVVFKLTFHSKKTLNVRNNNFAWQTTKFGIKVLSSTFALSIELKHPNAPVPKRSQVRFIGREGDDLVLEKQRLPGYLPKKDWSVLSKITNGITEGFQTKLLGKLAKGDLINRKNASAYKSLISMAAELNSGHELIDHPPNSPNLEASTVHLFSSFPLT